MAVAERKAGVSNEVGQAVSAAQQALLGVLLKASMGLVNGGLKGQGRGRVGLVLQATKLRWYLSLLPPSTAELHFLRKPTNTLRLLLVASAACEAAAATTTTAP